MIAGGEHIHDCTGPGMACPCGYVFRMPPISFSIDVFNRREEIINDHFNCENFDAVIDALEVVIEKLRAYGPQGEIGS